MIVTVFLYKCTVLSECQETNEYIPLQEVSDCLSGDGDLFHQLYDISKLACRNCAQNSTFQTTSENGMYFICALSCRNKQLKTQKLDNTIIQGLMVK